MHYMFMKMLKRSEKKNQQTKYFKIVVYFRISDNMMEWNQNKKKKNIFLNQVDKLEEFELFNENALEIKYRINYVHI
ncbi:CLUMA_CG012540, isoform A [Clunio marinus]|uniref:CLUMA_CG012540, isoform A n=1 Tax=Clunio marinus TaxID=568069 RepID=A0A1J1IG49_9DIPT|nr:CLUMA_CG012540, isoform A [Clunio marinus]